MRNAKDVALNLEANAPTRGSLGWSIRVVTPGEGSLRFRDGITPTAGDDFAAIPDVFLNRTGMELAVVNGAVATSGSQRLWARCVISNGRRIEPLEAMITVSVTAPWTFAVSPSIGWVVL